MSGEEVWKIVGDLPKVVEHGCAPKIGGYHVEHNWTKQSIFWELHYWKDNLVRHNLDVIHIEKNIFDNVFYTVMDIKAKTKDNIKASMDLKEYCRRRELELVEMASGQFVKPKAKYAFTSQ